MKKQLLPAIIGIVVALLAGLIILWAQGYPPLQSYAALFSYSLFSRFAFFSTLDKATPLILTGLSAAVGFGSNCVNLGQPGQFLIGAMAVTAFGIAVDLPAAIMIPLSILVALAAGACWSGIAAGLRRRFNMDEFITTLMLNFIADYFTLYLISGPMLDTKMYSPLTPMTNSGAWLPIWNGFGSAFLVAVAAFAVVSVLWNRSKIGYEWRAMGQNPIFSRTGGCRNDAAYVWAMLLSGALAGLAGGLMIMGGMQHRFVKGIGANYAWDGVMIAIVANNNILATGLYALFFSVLQTIVVLFVVASRESTRMLMNNIAAEMRMKRARGRDKGMGDGRRASNG